jgi:hypothetical protein
MILLSSVAIFFGHGMPSNALNLALQTAASVPTLLAYYSSLPGNSCKDVNDEPERRNNYKWV